jgi:hypothetical protein
MNPYRPISSLVPTLRRLIGMSLLTVLLLTGYSGESGASGLTELSALTVSVREGDEGTSRFVISGDEPRLIVIRGLGPSVTYSDKGTRHRHMIRDPKLVLSSGATPIASNDNWRDDANADQIPPELQPSDAAEAALARTLAPGEYVVSLRDNSNRGQGDASGIISVTQVESETQVGVFRSVCPILSLPCQSIATSNNGAAVECILSGSTCGVDLDVVVQGLSSLGYAVSATTPMWIQAWGGGGGHSTGGGSGSAGGYAQTTTSVADFTATYGSSMLFYFIGADGASCPEACGGAGGSATIVSAQDLSMYPLQPPTQDDVLLIAGGSGGGSGHGGSGCTGLASDGGRGGVAIASLSADGQGPGDNSPFWSGSPDMPQGGNGGQGGWGWWTAGGGTVPANGGNGYGGLGGPGGSGYHCQWSESLVTQFLNAPRTFTFDSAGLGGIAGTDTSTCDTGGGGGGGGYGGGGGGGHGGNLLVSTGGGGGGSFARKSTQVSAIAPTSEPTEDCPDNSTIGCVQIYFDLTQTSPSP